MFTLEQIKEAHLRVKTGADFASYVEDLVKLGVTRYDTFPADGHCVYSGDGDFRLTSRAAYSPMTVANPSDKGKFLVYLQQHQLGQTDYPAFCEHATASGVEKWTVDFELMTCTYFDQEGDILLVESIP